MVGVPHVQKHDGDVGGGDLCPQRVGVLSQAGSSDRAPGGRIYSRCVWSGDGSVLLGQGSYRAVVFGQ